MGHESKEKRASMTFLKRPNNNYTFNEKNAIFHLSIPTFFHLGKFNRIFDFCSTLGSPCCIIWLRFWFDGIRGPSMAVKSTARDKFNSQDVHRHESRTWLYLLLLTLQYGAQPLLSKRFSGREVIVTSSVLACEWAKVLCALILMAREGSLARLCKEWSFVGSLTASGLPAAIYALQNSLLQLSYRNLDSLTFSMLNQTKLFFTALFMYWILGQKQSLQQIGALVLLITAALLLSIGEGSGKGSRGVDPDQAFLLGIIPVMAASVLSGLASSLCQWASQVKKRSSYLMTIEMSAIGSLCLLASTFKSPDGETIRQRGFFSGWTIWTLILDQ
eukprot:Gb_16003 [translate_table: standard]